MTDFQLQICAKRYLHNLIALLENNTTTLTYYTLQESDITNILITTSVCIMLLTYNNNKTYWLVKSEQLFIPTLLCILN